MEVFIAGVMQASRNDDQIHGQDYRTQIEQALRKHIPDILVTDPFGLHPNSVHYGPDKVVDTFKSMTARAADSDLVIAFLPEASMGTAIEMWEAHLAGKRVVAVTPMVHNWVVRITAERVLPDLESLLESIASGELLQLPG